MASHPHDIQPSDMIVSQKKVRMLSILIHGPKQAGIDIDVFLELLMEDMAKLWNEGVCMWDQYQQEYFTLYAIIFVCIHNALGALHYQGRLKGRVAHVLFV
jgi:hypothetical protein